MTQPDLFTSTHRAEPACTCGGMEGRTLQWCAVCRARITASRAHYRRTDPATSRDAALSVPASVLEQAVIAWMLKQGTRGGNSLEMAEDTGLSRVSLSPRFKPLEKAGTLIRTTERRGRSQVWVHKSFGGRQ